MHKIKVKTYSTIDKAINNRCLGYNYYRIETIIKTTIPTYQDTLQAIFSIVVVPPDILGSIPSNIVMVTYILEYKAIR